ncbi:MAG: C2H2-type zinc finger protein [Nitrososphaerales archaeon]
MQTERPVDIPAETAPVPEKGIGTPPSAQGSFQCNVCGQMFTNQADLAEHMLTHKTPPSSTTKSEKDQPAGVA